MSDEKTVEALLLFCDALDNAVMTLRRDLKQINIEIPQPHEEPTSVPETFFSNLRWKDENGAKLGAYQIALTQDNPGEEWGKAYKFLEERSAAINKRFHEESYGYSYWIYSKTPYKIYRQKLKEAHQ